MVRRGDLRWDVEGNLFEKASVHETQYTGQALLSGTRRACLGGTEANKAKQSLICVEGKVVRRVHRVIHKSNKTSIRSGRLIQDNNNERWMEDAGFILL